MIFFAISLFSLDTDSASRHSVFMTLEDKIDFVGDILDRILLRDFISLNGMIACALNDFEPVAEAPNFIGDMGIALSTIPQGWWWHISHLECAIIPTFNDPLIPLQNAQFYRIDGSPIRYSVQSWGDDRSNLPIVIVTARLKVAMAILRVELAKQDQNYQFIDTGCGPMIATPNGTITEIPHGKYLSWSNRLNDVPEQEPYLRIDPRFTLRGKGRRGSRLSRLAQAPHK